MSGCRKEHKRAVLIGGGTVDIDWLRAIIGRLNSDLFVAVDKGLEAIDKIKTFPDVIVGDFDSLSNLNLIDKYKKMGSEIVKFSPEKDYTDMYLACDEAIKRDCLEIIMIGATGSRVDHMLGNIYLLKRLSQKQIKSCILDKNNKVRYLSTKENVFYKDDYYKYISFLPLGEEVKGLYLTGFKYPTVNLDLKSDDILTISNEIIRDRAILKISSSGILVVESRDEYVNLIKH